MRVIDEALNGVVLLEPDIHRDERGSFFESYNKVEFDELTGKHVEFMQDNHSTSRKGVVRGIHYQIPKAQGKLVRCVDGTIWDVAVDLRRQSPTVGQWVGYELAADNQLLLWVPEGFGHGFSVLSSQAQVLYKTTATWDRSCERSIRWNDPTLAIDWRNADPAAVSVKDGIAPFFDEAVLFD
jgi:dTDP-4-dehydrorhamnose 3,5-epimerase